MPASPTDVRQRPPAPRRRRRRRLHLADVLVAAVVVVLASGFAGARRLGLAPRQPVASPALPPAPSAVSSTSIAPEAAPVSTVAPTTTTTTVPPVAPRRSPDVREPFAFGTEVPAPPTEEPFAPRSPSTARPVRMLVVGDALAAGLGRALAHLGAEGAGVEVRTRSVAPSGLARPDVYDWPDRVASSVVPSDEVVVIVLGLNDAQPLSRSATPTGAVGTAAWTAGYRARVGALIAGSGPRPVVVIGVAAVETTARDRELEAVRAALAAEAAAHVNVRYFDLNALVSDGGRFVRFADRGDGTQIVARSNDGEQFTEDGYAMVATHLLLTMWPPAG